MDKLVLDSSIVSLRLFPVHVKLANSKPNHIFKRQKYITATLATEVGIINMLRSVKKEIVQMLIHIALGTS